MFFNDLYILSFQVSNIAATTPRLLAFTSTSSAAACCSMWHVKGSATRGTGPKFTSSDLSKSDQCHYQGGTVLPFDGHSVGENEVWKALWLRVNRHQEHVGISTNHTQKVFPFHGILLGKLRHSMGNDHLLQFHNYLGDRCWTHLMKKKRVVGCDQCS